MPAVQCVCVSKVCDSDLVSTYCPSKYKNTFIVSLCLHPTVQTTEEEYLIFRIHVISSTRWVGHILSTDKERTVKRITAETICGKEEDW